MIRAAAVMDYPYKWWLSANHLPVKVLAVSSHQPFDLLNEPSTQIRYWLKMSSRAAGQRGRYFDNSRMIGFLRAGFVKLEAQGKSITVGCGVGYLIKCLTSKHENSVTVLRS